MWKYLESLAAQVGAFKEATRIQDNQHSIKSEDIMAGGAIIEYRVTILEEKAKLESQSLLPSSRVTDHHSCPAVDCLRTFKTQDNLNTHIRQATSYGHMALQKMINQRICLPCGELQPRPKDLINHERSTIHGDSYGSRVEKFSMHPKSLRHKHRDGQYLIINAKRVERSPTSSPNLKLSRSISLDKPAAANTFQPSQEVSLPPHRYDDQRPEQRKRDTSSPEEPTATSVPAPDLVLSNRINSVHSLHDTANERDNLISGSGKVTP